MKQVLADLSTGFTDLKVGDIADATILTHNVGPGPQHLTHYDQTLDIGYFGWYGETAGHKAEDAFMSGNDVKNALTIPEGYSMGGTPSNDGWLKFWYKGKILFVAKQDLTSSVSWDSIYMSGAVYGTDDIGKYGIGSTEEDYHAGGSMTQDARLTKEGNTFKIRLMLGATDDPSNTRGREWNDLMYRIHVSDVLNLGVNLWASFTSEDLDMDGNRLAHCQETTLNINNNILRGGNDDITRIITSFAKSSTSSQRVWRPVLELEL